MEHYWLDLAGPVWFSGAEIYRRFVGSVTRPSIAVELGAWKGRSTCFMGVEIANSGKPITFYTVDHWQGVGDQEGYEPDADDRAGRLFEVFQRNIAPVAAHVNVIRSDTAQAAEQFADGSIDFLYVDASHAYDGVLRDLLAWFPKVKLGGTIAGDDWCFSVHGEHTVRNAVMDFFGSRAPIKIEAGSGTDPEWHQWSIAKTAELKPRSRAQIKMRSAVRGLAPTRVLHALRRLLR